jgi:hypothetical protein
MIDLDPIITDGHQQVLASVEDQIRELQPTLQRQAEIAAVATSLARLETALTNAIVGFSNVSLDRAIELVDDIKAGQAPLSDLGSVLVDLSLLQESLQQRLQEMLDSVQISRADSDTIESMLVAAISRVKQLLNTRPDVATIMDDLTALKNLRGGPADATSFHDFHVLQIAFKNVWLHAFDENLRNMVQDLYTAAVRLYTDLGLTVPNFDAVNDIDQLNRFIADVQRAIDPDFPGSVLPPPPPPVVRVFPEAVTAWYLFDEVQRASLVYFADLYEEFGEKRILDTARTWLAEAMRNPRGNVSRLTRLLSEIAQALSEPYAFDVFAPDSYNFGVMITYRQKWEPGAYQAGDLAATIPLAPGESRKFTTKRSVKTSRAEKELEKSMSSRSEQTSEIARAEADIMQKVTTATNFKMTAHGSFNIGVGTLTATSDFGGNQDQQSTLNKKAFHEATVKAAEEYRLERSLQVDTTSSLEMEETTSGEVTNPNNEITVTYLFYELQRRFRIHEFLYRVRPVVLVAQDVPAPHEIDEAWLIQYQWILSRVLLDDSLRPALYYLTTGFAGDETSISIIKAQWEAQASLLRDLEGQVKSQLVQRDVFRAQLEGEEIARARAEAKKTEAGSDIAQGLLSPGSAFAAALTGGLSTLFTVNNAVSDLDEAVATAAMAEATRKAAETRLQYAEQALADAQDKLKEATGAFQEATEQYAAALKNQFTRHVMIDQLRVHVKQNILYYMQAIWDHEPPDQRFFRLYNKMVRCPSPDPNCSPTYSYAGMTSAVIPGNWGGSEDLTIVNIDSCPPIDTGTTELVEIADLDNPLGYKGNYIIFPVKGECYLTQYMLSEFIDDYLGVRDPDGSDDFDAEAFELDWQRASAIEDASARNQRLAELRADLQTYVSTIRRSTDDIIIPTGQLFIEALPGAHPLLEDFKLLHRLEDVRKVKAEVRHAEFENLRLAARLIGSQATVELLDDPDVEKKIIIESDGASVTVADGG